MNDHNDIAAIAEKCRHVFRERVAEIAMAQQRWLHSAQGDFNLWCIATRAIGTGKSSLSYCLREDKIAQQEICKLLQALVDSVNAACEAVAEHENDAGINDDESPSEVRSESSLCWAAASDDSNDLEEDFISDPLVAEHVAYIGLFTNQLSEIAMATRKFGLKYRFASIDAAFDESVFGEFAKHLTAVILEEFEESSAHTAKEKMTRAEGWTRLNEVQKRLVRLNMLRRHRIEAMTKPRGPYARKPHKTQMMTTAIETSSATPQSQIPEVLQGKPEMCSNASQHAPQRPDSLAKSDAAPDITNIIKVGPGPDDSMRPIVARKSWSTTPGMIRAGTSHLYPSCPSQDEDGALIYPYCDDVMPEEYSEAEHEQSWNLHVMQDLIPYSCIAEQCTQEEEMFLTANDLVDHMLAEHSVLRWVCDYCTDLNAEDGTAMDEQKFHTAEDWVSHVESSHESLIATEHRNLHAEMNKRRLIGPLSCPICGFTDNALTSVINDHILCHLHQFALWALPERTHKWPVRIQEALNLPADVADGSRYIRRANSRDSCHLAAIEQEGSDLVLTDSQGIRLLSQKIIDDGLKTTTAVIEDFITLAEQLARAHHILAWARPRGKEKLEHDLRITFGTVKDLEQCRIIEQDGNDFVFEDENIYIPLENNSHAKTIFVSAFDINIAGKVAHISNGSPRGIKLQPETDYCIGKDDFELEWPENVSRTQSVNEFLVFIITDQPIDLRHLATEASAGDQEEIDQGRFSPEQQTFSQATAAISDIDISRLLGRLQYDILRIPFLLRPFTPKSRDSPEENDRRQWRAHDLALPEELAQDLPPRPPWLNAGSRACGGDVNLQDPAFVSGITTVQLQSQRGSQSQSRDLDADRTTKVDLLASSWLKKFMHTQSSRDINQAIDLWTTEISRNHRPGPLAARRLERLGECFSERARVFDSEEDLKRAVQLTEEAINGMTLAHPNYPDFMMSLANRLNLLSSRSRSMNDLDRAVHAAEVAAVLTLEDHPLRPVRLEVHGAMLCERSERTGSIEDLRCAIGVLDMGLQASPHGHPVALGLLGGMGRCLGNMYDYTGLLGDLDKSIECLNAAVAGMSRDHPHITIYLNLLGTQLSKRHEHTGSMDDIDHSIKTLQQTLDMISEHNPLRLTLMTNISASLLLRYGRTGAVDDLQNAIDTTDSALRATPPGHEAYAARSANLWAFLSRRYEKFRSINDLDRANELLRTAVALLPHDDPRRPLEMNNLASGLFTRFLETQSNDDLDEAIDVLKIATKIIPENHPERAMVFENLVRCYYRRGQHTVDDQMRCSLEGWNSRNSPPSIRIAMAYLAAGLLNRNDRYEESSQILEDAVSLLPSVSARALKGSDQQHMLQKVPGLASLAASTALHSGKSPVDAIRLLESGRGIMAGLLFETRTEIEGLKQSCPQLADEFSSLRDKLDSPSSIANPQLTEQDTSSWETQAKQRRELESRFNEVVAEIRTKPGFEDFLLPPKAETLLSAASSGPIVVLNATFWRCDAIIINSSGIQSLPLPRLGLLNIEGGIQFSTYSLESMWDVIARPILDHLGFTESPEDGNFPHVWWILTGSLSRLPIHAAGYHYEGSSETVIDRVVSSYSTSIKALLQSRQNSFHNIRRGTSHKACLISMRNTPSQGSLEPSDLEFAEQEIQTLHSLLSPAVPTTLLSQPDKDDVLLHLESCTAFHFAGHGITNSLDPSKSSLLLNDWVNSPLTVDDLTALKLFEKSPWLAYLSACSTGENQAERLQDESIHLVSACQLAGFPHVVGSLWRIDDECSVEAAAEVYRTIVEHGWTDESVARGVHNAARLLRKKTTGEVWARRVKLLDSRDLDVLSHGKIDTNQERHRGFEEYAVRSEGEPSIWAAYIHVGR